jgi:hypothetical protein
MQEIDRRERKKTLFPGNSQEISIKHQIDRLVNFKLVLLEISHFGYTLPLQGRSNI